jgi:hypothetical protein
MPPDPATDSAGRHQLTHELSELTDRVTARRVVTVMAREGRLSLSGKLAALTESAHDFNKQTEAVLDGIAAKIVTAKIKRDAAAEKHHGYYDEIIKGVDESSAVIDRLSNGPLHEDGEG